MSTKIVKARQAKNDQKPPHGNSRYDWATWMNGEAHVATIGKEIKAGQSVESFRASLFAKVTHFNKRMSAQGSENRVKCTTRVLPEGVWFQFVWGV